jgi:hypothetical protein
MVHVNSALSLAQQRLECTGVDGTSISSQPDLGDGTCEDLLSHWHSKRWSITEADGMSISLQPGLGDGTCETLFSRRHSTWRIQCWPLLRVLKFPISCARAFAG